ncbi:MAG TPA: Ig-like domain-containing protein [Gemmatimonadaceae bacterium]|nr:Ig-like domain-containing protein [Gemmatimonadaceae bacterium]
MNFRRRSAAIGLALLVAACSGGSDKPTGSDRPVVATVSVNSSTPTIFVGATANFNATALDKKGVVVAGRTTSWSTSDAAVASVTPAGVVTGVAPGQATIRATIDGIVGSAQLTVLAATVAVVEVRDAPASALLPGETTRLTAFARNDAGEVIAGKTFVWSTSNAAVATVSSDGTVLAVAPGSATISASADGKSASAALTVEARALTRIVVTPAPMLAAIGGSAQAAAEGIDQRGKPIVVQQFTFQSSNPAIATVSPSGLVTGVSAGTAAITAGSQNIIGSTTVSVVSPTTVAGSLVSPAAGPFANLTFAIRTGSGASMQTFSTTVDGSGAFSLAAPLPQGAADSVTLLVDDNARPRIYHPIAKPVRAAVATTAATHPLLVPESETFTSPTYGTSTVSISLQSAFTRVCFDDTNANCNSFFPQVWIPGIVPLWSAADFPIPLAFNHTATTSPITATDSTALWTVIHQMEADLGRPLFKPVNFSSLTPPDANGYSPKAVLVWVDSTLTGFSGYSNWIWENGTQNMIAAKTRVRLNSFLSSRSLMSHELLHDLGFHHTCAWSTVMGGYGCSSAAGITMTDAAGFNLAYQTRAAIVASHPTTTFGDALRGEQTIEGAPVAALLPAARAIPFASVGLRTLVFSGRQVRGDGAP